MPLHRCRNIIVATSCSLHAAQDQCNHRAVHGGDCHDRALHDRHSPGTAASNVDIGRKFSAGIPDIARWQFVVPEIAASDSGARCRNPVSDPGGLDVVLDNVFDFGR